MELDDKTLKGHWSTDSNRGVEFFIINDGMFSKLCILGEEVEPCFEGASVTAPEVSSKFSKDDNFVKTLFSMVQELKELTYQLQDKGGNPMDGEVVKAEFTEEATPEAKVEEQVATEQPAENFFAEEGKSDSEITEKTDNITEEFVKKEEKEDEDKKEEEDKADEEDTNKDDDSKEDDDEDKKKKFALIESELEELKTQYASLKAENEALVAFKNAVEDEKKTDLINSFYMLSDEDKKEVIENKANYSLDDIEAKLSVICVRKKVNFNMDSDSEKEEQPAVTFNLHAMEEVESLPAWLKAVEERNANN